MKSVEKALVNVKYRKILNTYTVAIKKLLKSCAFLQICLFTCANEIHL